jgi:hypothetical protein
MSPLIRPMDELGHLLLPPGEPDERGHGVGDHREQLRVEDRGAGAGPRRQGGRPVADDEQDAPRPLPSRDRRSGLGHGGRQDRQGHPLARLGDDGHGATAGPAGCGIQRPPEDPEGPRQLGQGRHIDPAARRGGDGSEALALELPERYEREIARVPDPVGDTIQGRVEVARQQREAGDVVEQGELVPASRGDRRAERDRLRGRAATAALLGDGPDHGIEVDAARGSPGSGCAQGVLLRRGEEPLEVAEAITPVTPGVDPVVAQPARVAPRAHRVGVHAEQARRLRHRQRRVRRSRRQVHLHARTGGTVKSTVARLPASQFLPIGRWS